MSEHVEELLERILELDEEDIELLADRLRAIVADRMAEVDA
jgi:hypothetical protein